MYYIIFTDLVLKWLECPLSWTECGTAPILRRVETPFWFESVAVSVLLLSKSGWSDRFWRDSGQDSESRGFWNRRKGSQPNRARIRGEAEISSPRYRNSICSGWAKGAWCCRRECPQSSQNRGLLDRTPVTSHPSPR